MTYEQANSGCIVGYNVFQCSRAEAAAMRDRLVSIDSDQHADDLTGTLA